MKDKKSKSIIFTFSIIILLIISSINSFGISVKTNNNNNVEAISSSATPVIRTKTSSRFVTALTTPLNSGKIGTLSENGFIETDNIVIANSIESESYPSMALSGLNAIIAYEYEDNTGTAIYLRYSEDYGETWVGPYYFSNINLNTTSPSFTKLCYGSDDAFGSFITPENTSYIYEAYIPKIIDKSTWIAFPVDYSELVDGSTGGYVGTAYNFQNPDVVCFPDSNIPWIISTIGDANFIPEYDYWDCTESPMFLYQDPEDPEESRFIVFFPDVQKCSNISVCLGKDSGSDPMIYGVCEINNGTSQNLLFFSGNPDIWSNVDDLINQTIPDSENFSHPKIFAQDNHIYITAETDDNEIVMYHSSNYGVTWDDYIVTENHPPDAEFSYSAKRLNVSFFDESTDFEGYIASWYWEFGDGNTSTDRNPQHKYGAEGDYTVYLTVKDNENAESKTSKTITLVNTTPIANFTHKPIKPSANENITFNSTSTAYPAYHIENYTWDFGDESNLTFGENVTHQYLENGTYIVNLTVRDNVSVTDSIEKAINVGLVADFTFSPDLPTIDDTINFNDLSSIPEGSTITEWTWDFGDGTSLVYQQNTTHQYMFPGIYSVNLTIKDNHNAIDSVLKQITVKPGPGSFIPRYPTIFANITHVFCIFTLGSNLYITDSLDHGGSWSDINQLNDQIYSVVEGYRFADMPDISHVVWTDHRAGNYDLYSVVRGRPEIDLLIVPGSINITRSKIPFFTTNNWISFNVRNIGEIFVEYVEIEVTINRANKDPITTGYPEIIKRLDGNGDEKSCERPLFRISIRELIRALIDFIGIQSITVTVDPENLKSDIDTSNNAFTLTDVTYGDIFPLIGRFLGS